jgi:hypothetical protein
VRTYGDEWLVRMSDERLLERIQELRTAHSQTEAALARAVNEYKRRKEADSALEAVARADSPA